MGLGAHSLGWGKAGRELHTWQNLRRARWFVSLYFQVRYQLRFFRAPKGLTRGLDFQSSMLD